MAFLNEAGLERLWYHIVSKLGTKVDAIEGKSLSENDYTTAEKDKLNGIAVGANKTVVDSSLSDSSTNPVQNKIVNAALNDAKAYADSIASTAANTVKNDLLNGAGEAYDTLKELGDLIDDNTDAIDALESVAMSKVAQSDFNNLSEKVTSNTNRLDSYSTEVWTFTLTDGTVVSKEVVLK